MNVKNIDELKKQLIKIGNLYNDWNSNGIVQDIIDPDRYPELFDNEEAIFENKYKLLQKEYFCNNYNRLTKYNDKNILKENINNNMNDDLKYRWSYHWRPIRVEILKDFKSVKFLDEIPGLPRSAKLESVYLNLEEVFKAMLHGFEQLGLISKDTDNKLQIIFKAQKYVINSKVSYTGKWHTEGVSENIRGVGVYYLNVDNNADGGHLKFRPKVLPYLYDYKKLLDFSTKVKVKSNSAFVFDNSLAHRFTSIINDSSSPAIRLFINFFIIDPLTPLPNPTTSIKHKYDDDIIRKRENIRKALLNYKNEWGCITYGNSGEIAFVNNVNIDNKLVNEIKMDDFHINNDLFKK